MPLMALSSPTPYVVQRQAYPMDPRISVSGIGGVEFVAVAYPVESFVFTDGVGDGERVVAGDAKDFFDAE